MIWIWIGIIILVIWWLILFIINVSDFGESSLDMTDEEYKQACDDYNAELKRIQYEERLHKIYVLEGEE